MQAAALVVGPDDGPGAALYDVARDVGFASVRRYAGPVAAEQQAMLTPLLFFLFAAVEHPQALKPVADAVRFAPGRRIRFSPMIYCAESPSLEMTRACLEMGFDDILTPPFARHRLVGRLRRLVDRLQIYRETPTYLGPERAGHWPGQHRRLEIVRSARAGVTVLRDEIRRPGVSGVTGAP